MRALLFVFALIVLSNSYRIRRKVSSPEVNTCVNQKQDVGTPLLLTPLVEKGMYSEAMSLSKAVVDGVDLGHSGFFSVPSASGKNTNNLFFWFQPCMTCANISDAPLILWLQGGPGAPSTFGSLDEIGPYYVDGNCKLQKRCNTWCDPNHSCMFIDNPVQTGFSYQLNATGQYDPNNIEYTKTSAEAGQQMRGLLDQFFKVFSKVSTSPFWITGESYGGNYVANLAKVILDTNTNENKINLVGVSVGDPVMNSPAQWPTYAGTLYGMGLINLQQKAFIADQMAKGINAMLTQSCKAGFDYWNSVWNDNGEAPTPFYYKKFSGSSTTYEQLLFEDPESMSWSINWLALDQVAKGMHFGGSPANQQAEGGPIYDTMVASGDFCQNSSDIYADLLTKYGIDVQIYSSTNDPLLGPPCSEAGVEAIMTRAGLTEQWHAAPRDLWSDNKGLNGYATCINYSPKNTRFCFPIVRNAGHMSPAFQPRANLDMTLRFMRNQPFTGLPLSPLPDCKQCSAMPPFAVCGCN